MLSKLVLFSGAVEAVRIAHRGSSGGPGPNVEDDHFELVLQGAKKCNGATASNCLQTEGVPGRYCHWDDEMKDCFFSCDEFEDKYHKEFGTSLADCASRDQCEVQNADRDDCDPNSKFFKLHDTEDSEEDVKKGRAACNDAQAQDQAKCTTTSSGVKAKAGQAAERMCHWSHNAQDCFYSCDEFQDAGMQDQCELHEECMLKADGDCDGNAMFYSANTNDSEDKAADVAEGAAKCKEKKGETDCIATTALAEKNGVVGPQCKWEGGKINRCFFSCDQFEAQYASKAWADGGFGGFQWCKSFVDNCKVTSDAGSGDCDPINR